jgi:hypothetical protein
MEHVYWMDSPFHTREVPMQNPVVIPRPQHASADDSLDTRRQAALDRCDGRIRWYERYARKAWMWWYALQMSVIVLGGLTPILILVSDLPKTFQALPSAIAVVAASINGMFRSRADALRYAYARDMLASEKARYTTRTGSYSARLTGEQALDRFMRHIEEISTKEICEWRNEHTRGLPKTDDEPASATSANGKNGAAPANAH